MDPAEIVTAALLILNWFCRGLLLIAFQELHTKTTRKHLYIVPSNPEEKECLLTLPKELFYFQQTA